MNTQKLSLIEKMAGERSMRPDDFYQTIKQTIMPRDATEVETAAFLVVADKYGLDPFLKHIHCFIDTKRGGKIVPVISIDGWAFMVNQHPQYDGVEFDYEQDSEGKFVSCTARMFRKDRSRATAVTEFLIECWRNTDAWKQTPGRMLRHRAFAQAARLCFGFSAALDEDEQMRDITPVPEVQVAAADIKRTASPRPPSPKQRQEQTIDGEAKREEKSTEKAKERDERQEGTDTRLEPEKLLRAFTGALTTAKTAQDLDDIIREWDIIASLTHSPDHLELAEAKIKQTRKRLQGAAGASGSSSK